MAHMRSRPFSRVSVICSSCVPTSVSPTYFHVGGGGDKTPILSTADFSSFVPKPTQPSQQQQQQQQQQRVSSSTCTTPTKYGSLGGTAIEQTTGSASATTTTNFSPHHYHNQHPPPPPPPAAAAEKDQQQQQQQQPIGSIPSLRISPSESDVAAPGVLPIALEPTDDGIAAVATVILELPRGSDDDDALDNNNDNGGVGSRRGGHELPPDRICLGSSLVMMRVLYPMLLSHAQGTRSVLVHRRRPSHGAS